MVDGKDIRLGSTYHRAIEKSPEQARVEKAMDKTMVSNEAELMAMRDVIQREMPGVQFGFDKDFVYERGVNNQSGFQDFVSGLYNAGVQTVEGIAALPGAIGVATGAGENSWATNWVDAVDRWADGASATYSQAGQQGVFGGGGIAGLWAGLGNGLGTVLTMMGGGGIGGAAARGMSGVGRIGQGVSALDKVNKAMKYQKVGSKVSGFMTGTAQMYPGIYEEALDKGLSPGEAMRYAMGVSGLISLSEGWALDKIGKTMSKPVTGKLARESASESLDLLKSGKIGARSFEEAIPLTMKTFAQKAKMHGAKMFEGAAIEGGQEFAQTYIEEIAKTFWDDRLEGDIWSKDTFVKALEGGLIGGLIGGGMPLMAPGGTLWRGVQGESAWSVVNSDVAKGKTKNIAALKGMVVKDTAAGKYTPEEAEKIQGSLDEMYKFAKSIEPLKIQNGVQAYQLYQMQQVSDVVNRSNEAMNMKMMVDNPVIQGAYKKRQDMANAITEQLNNEMQFVLDSKGKITKNREQFESRMDGYIKLYEDVMGGKKKIDSEQLEQRLEKLAYMKPEKTEGAEVKAKGKAQTTGKPEAKKDSFIFNGNTVPNKVMEDIEDLEVENSEMLSMSDDEKISAKKAAADKYGVSYDVISDVLKNKEAAQKEYKASVPAKEKTIAKEEKEAEPKVSSFTDEKVYSDKKLETDLKALKSVKNPGAEMKERISDIEAEQKNRIEKKKKEFVGLAQKADSVRELDAIMDQADEKDLSSPELIDEIAKRRKEVGGTEREYNIEDGHHRTMAHDEEGKETIRAVTKKGGKVKNIPVKNLVPTEPLEDKDRKVIDSIKESIRKGEEIEPIEVTPVTEENRGKKKVYTPAELEEEKRKTAKAQLDKEYPLTAEEAFISEPEYSEESESPMTELEIFPEKEKLLKYLQKNTVVKAKEQRSVLSPSSVDSLIKNNPELHARIVSHFRKVFPNVPVEYLNDALRMGGPGIMGRLINGIVQINPDTARQSTIIHEYAHIFVELLGDEHPWIKAGIVSIEGTSFDEWAKKEYSDKPVAVQKKEALVQAIAERSLDSLNRKLNNGMIGNFLDWMKRFWGKVKSMFTKSKSVDMIRLLSDEMTFNSRGLVVPRNSMFGVKMEQRSVSTESVLMDHMVNAMMAKRIELFVNPQMAQEVDGKDPHVYYYGAIENLMDSYVEFMKVDPVSTVKQFGGFNFIPRNENDRAEMFQDFFMEFQRWYGSKGSLDERIRRAAQHIASTNTEVDQDDNEDAVRKDRNDSRVKGNKKVNDTITSIINSLVDDQGFPLGKDNIQQYITDVNNSSFDLVEKVKQDALLGKSIEAVRLNDLFDAISESGGILNSFKNELSSLASNNYVVFEVIESVQKVKRQPTDEELDNGVYEEGQMIDDEVSIPKVRMRLVNQNKSIEATQKEMGNYLENLKDEVPSVYSDFKSMIAPMFWVDDNNKFEFKIPQDDVKRGIWPNIWKVMKNESSSEDVDYAYNLMQVRFPMFVEGLNNVLSEFNVQISDQFLNDIVYKKVDQTLDHSSSKYQSQVVSGQIGFVTNMIRFMNKQPDNFGNKISIKNYLSKIVSDQKNISNLSASFIGVEGTNKQSVSLSHYVNEIVRLLRNDDSFVAEMKESLVYKNNPLLEDIVSGKAVINKLDGIENMLSKKVKEYEQLSGTDILLYNVLQFSTGSYDQYNQNPMINADRDMTFTITAKRYNTDEEINEQLNMIRSRMQSDLEKIKNDKPENYEKTIKMINNTSLFGVSDGKVYHPLQKGYPKMDSFLGEITSTSKLIEANNLQYSIRSILEQDKSSIYKGKPTEFIVRNYMLNDAINRIYSTDLFIGPMVNLKNTFDVIKRANGATSNGVLVPFDQPVMVVVVDTKGISDSFSVNGTHLSEHIKEQMGDLDKVGMNMKDMLYQVESNGAMTFLKMSSVNVFRTGDTTSLSELSRNGVSAMDYTKIGDAIRKLEDQVESKTGKKPYIKIVDKDCIKGTNKPNAVLTLDELVNHVENENTEAVQKASMEIDFRNYRVPFNMTHDVSENDHFEQTSRLSTQLLKIVTNFSTVEELMNFEQSIVDINLNQMGLKEGQEMDQSKTYRDLNSSSKFIDSLLEGSEERKDTPITILLREIATYNSRIQKQITELFKEKEGMPENSDDRISIENRIDRLKKQIASSMDHPMMKRIMEQTIASKMHKDGVRLEIPGQYLHNIPDYGSNLKWYERNPDGSVKSFPEVALPWSMFGNTKEEAEKALQENPRLRDVVVVRVPASGPMSTFKGTVKYLIDGKSNTSILPKEFLKHAGADHDGDKTFVYRRDHFMGMENTDSSASKMMDYMVAQMSKKEYVEQALFELESNDMKAWLTQSGLYNQDEFNISSPKSFSDTASKMNFGMKGIGVVAVGMKMMNVMSQSNVKLKEPVNFNYSFDGLNRSFTKDKQLEKFTTDRWKDMAIVVQAVVDMIKDPYVLGMGIDGNNINIASLLIQLGVDYKSVAGFLTDPSIVEYKKMLEESDNIFGKGFTGSPDEMLQRYLKKNEPKDVSKWVNAKPVFTTGLTETVISDMKAGVYKYNGEYYRVTVVGPKRVQAEITEIENMVNLDIIKTYIQLRTIANDVFDLGTIVQIDGDLPNNSFDTKKMLNTIDKIRSGNTTLDTGNFFDRPLVKHYVSVVKSQWELMQNRFFTNTNGINEIQEKLSGSFRISDKKFKAQSDKVVMDIMLQKFMNGEFNRFSENNAFSIRPVTDVTKFMNRMGAMVSMVKKISKGSSYVVLGSNGLPLSKQNFPDEYEEVYNAIAETGYDVDELNKRLAVFEQKAKTDDLYQSISRVMKVNIAFIENVGMGNLSESIDGLKDNLFIQSLETYVEKEGDKEVTLIRPKGDYYSQVEGYKDRVRKSFTELPKDLQVDFLRYQMYRGGISDSRGTLFQMIPYRDMNTGGIGFDLSKFMQYLTDKHNKIKEGGEVGKSFEEKNLPLFEKNIVYSLQDKLHTVAINSKKFNISANGVINMSPIMSSEDFSFFKKENKSEWNDRIMKIAKETVAANKLFYAYKNAGNPDYFNIKVDDKKTLYGFDVEVMKKDIDQKLSVNEMMGQSFSVVIAPVNQGGFKKSSYYTQYSMPIHDVKKPIPYEGYWNQFSEKLSGADLKKEEFISQTKEEQEKILGCMNLI